MRNKSPVLFLVLGALSGLVVFVSLVLAAGLISWFENVAIAPAWVVTGNVCFHIGPCSDIPLVLGSAVGGWMAIGGMVSGGIYLATHHAE